MPRGPQAEQNERHEQNAIQVSTLPYSKITALTPFVTLVWFTVIIPARVWQPECDRK